MTSIFWIHPSLPSLRSFLYLLFLHTVVLLILVHCFQPSRTNHLQFKPRLCQTIVPQRLDDFPFRLPQKSPSCSNLHPCALNFSLTAFTDRKFLYHQVHVWLPLDFNKNLVVYAVCYGCRHWKMLEFLFRSELIIEWVLQLISIKDDTQKIALCTLFFLRATTITSSAFSVP